jgi:hypothetical protein
MAVFGDLLHSPKADKIPLLLASSLSLITRRALPPSADPSPSACLPVGQDHAVATPFYSKAISWILHGFFMNSNVISERDA